MSPRDGPHERSDEGDTGGGQGDEKQYTVGSG